jgi:hypothetical protein
MEVGQPQPVGRCPVENCFFVGCIEPFTNRSFLASSGVAPGLERQYRRSVELCRYKRVSAAHGRCCYHVVERNSGNLAQICRWHFVFARNTDTYRRTRPSRLSADIIHSDRFLFMPQRRLGLYRRRPPRWNQSRYTSRHRQRQDRARGHPFDIRLGPGSEGTAR